MKAIFKTALGILLMSAALFTLPQKTAAQPVVSVQVFYDQLSPYGQWINHPRYGYIWRPTVEADFVPYSSGGHWIYSDAGWTWVSDYDWGWAPFHYGRWVDEPAYGWLWIPDTQWGPAWVAWRQSDDYFGWTPLGPGISISASFGSGYYNSVPAQRWIFVRQRDIVRPDIRNYYIRRTNNVTIINKTTIIRNTYVNSRHITYATGPSRTQVEKVTKTTVTKTSIHTTTEPGKVTVNNNTVNIYRPVVNKTVVNEAKPAPQKVVQMNEVERKNRADNQQKPQVQNQAQQQPVNNNNNNNSAPPKPQPVQPQQQGQPQQQPVKTQPQQHPQPEHKPDNNKPDDHKPPRK